MSKLPLVDGVLRKHHPLYGTWKRMRGRCNSKTHPRYADWGGRGIKVCSRWDDFANFASDMGERPEGYSLDRIDNDGDYCPENCKWSSVSEQNKNQRVRKDSISGVKGVRKCKDGYHARVYVDCVPIHLGAYDTIDEAELAVKLGRKLRETRRNNKTGVTGVSVDGNSYIVTMTVDGMTKYIKSTTDFFEAVCARKSAEVNGVR